MVRNVRLSSGLSNSLKCFDAFGPVRAVQARGSSWSMNILRMNEKLNLNEVELRSDEMAMRLNAS